VETLPPPTRDAFFADLCSAQETCRSAVVPQRADSRDNTWAIWEDFCLEHAVHPLLEDVEDPIHYLMVFAVRYRDGRLAKNGDPVRSRTVGDAIRAIGQTMARMGAKDQRLVAPRQVEYRLSQQLKGYTNVDPEPTRVKPAPLSLVRYCCLVARKADTTFDIAVADLIIIAFFYLCRPGEYAQSNESTRSTPFRLRDVVFCAGARRLNTFTSPLDEIAAASFALLTYSDQKNAVRGETIGHGSTRDSYVGPVHALSRRVRHLRQHNAPPDTPLHAVFVDGAWTSIRSSDLTAALRLAAIALHDQTGIYPSDISARSLRAGGAMALLCAHIDSDIIRLVGRWRSDEMLRYLHAQAYPLMHTFAQAMLDNGSFSLLPGQYVPTTALPLLNQVPL